jgi:hypothetical protein
MPLAAMSFFISAALPPNRGIPFLISAQNLSAAAGTFDHRLRRAWRVENCSAAGQSKIYKLT